MKIQVLNPPKFMLLDGEQRVACFLFFDAILIVLDEIDSDYPKKTRQLLPNLFSQKISNHKIRDFEYGFDSEGVLITFKDVPILRGFCDTSFLEDEADNEF